MPLAYLLFLLAYFMPSADTGGRHKRRLKSGAYIAMAVKAQTKAVITCQQKGWQ